MQGGALRLPLVLWALGIATGTSSSELPLERIAAHRPYYMNVGGSSWPNSSTFNTSREIGPNVVRDRVLILGTWFGDYPCLKCGGPQQATWCNGGIPQLANLTRHVETMRMQLEAELDSRGIKDGSALTDFVVVDYESWVPFYEHLHQDYKEASFNYTAWKYPAIAAMPNQSGIPILQELSEVEWHAAALEFLVTTAASLKTWLRNARGVGFYGYPTIYSKLGYPKRNKERAQRANDALMPLWEEVTALYPALYLPAESERTQEVQMEWVSDEIVEANRVASRAGPAKGLPGSKKVLPYSWYRYEPSPGPHEYDLLDPLDAWLEFDFPFSSTFPTQPAGDNSTSFVEGVIVWGSESDPANSTRAQQWLVHNKHVFTVSSS